VRGSRRSGSRIVFGTTKARVRFVAVTDRKLAGRRIVLRRYLRRAGLR